MYGTLSALSNLCATLTKIVGMASTFVRVARTRNGSLECRGMLEWFFSRNENETGDRGAKVPESRIVLTRRRANGDAAIFRLFHVALLELQRATPRPFFRSKSSRSRFLVFARNRRVFIVYVVVVVDENGMARWRSDRFGLVSRENVRFIRGPETTTARHLVLPKARDRSSLLAAPPWMRGAYCFAERQNAARPTSGFQDSTI